MTAQTPMTGAIPVLETARLRLRAPRMDDFEAYAAFGASPRAAILGGPFSRAQSFQRLAGIGGHWILRGYGRWLVADRETDAPLGVVGPFYPEGWPEPEIAWTVFDAAEGRGIAHEAALAARTYAYRSLGWQTAISCVAPDNRRSQALAERLGCRRDGLWHHPDGFDLVIWRHPAADEMAA